jgi:hypothetical protein
MTDLAQALLQSDELIKWYWKHGRRRTRYHLPYSWLIELYEQRDAARALSRSASGDSVRKSLAVWGPSQSGKSMLISSFLDARDGPRSALVWKEGDSFRFKPAREFPNVTTFNPRKEGTDASGCVTRFHLAEDVKDPDHPVEISFASRRQIMQAIATGYLMECRRELPDIGVVDVDEEFIRRELHPDNTDTPVQEAVERIVDVVAVIDRLLPDEYERFRKLKFADKIWQNQLRGALIADQALASSVDRAAQVGWKLLWDDRPKLNELFNQLDGYRQHIATIANGKPVMGSLRFAAQLVDIDTYGLLAGDVKDTPDKIARLSADLLNQTTFIEHEDRVVIGANPGGRRLFNNAADFGLFQGLVWELSVPLNAKFFRNGKHDDILAFLQNIEILDIPGVAKAQQGPERTMFDLDGKNAVQSKLLSEVLKRGKTATIINRYAEQLSVDGLLLLNVAGSPPAQPKQLIAGVEAIWRAAVSDYQASSGERPPIPLAFCLTFMAQKINENVKVGIERMNLASLEGTLSRFNELIQPGVSELFVTTYPDVPGAELRPEARIAAVREAVLKQDWVRTRFTSASEKNSWRALLEDDDGGVGHLLRSLSRSLASSSREHRIRTRAVEISRALTRLTETAAPMRDDDGHRHSRALNALADRLQSTLKNARPQDDVALTMSWQLRRLFAFDDEKLDPVPLQSADDRPRLETYVKGVLEWWVARPAARQLLAGMGVPEEDHIAILNALRQTVDVSTVVDWLMECMDSIDNARLARHQRRYVAAKCAELLGGRQREIADDPLDALPLAERNLARFRKWNEKREPVDSPHFDAVIAPTISRLKDIAKLNIVNDWLEQPGDGEIDDLKSAWAESMKGAATFRPGATT